MLFTSGPIPKSVWKYGDLLVVEPGACIPDRCVQCHSPSNGNRAVHRIFSYRPHGLKARLFFPATSIVSYLSERFTGQMPLVELPLCDSHRVRRDGPRLYALIAGAFGLASIATSLAITSPRLWAPSLAAWLIGTYATGAALWFALVSRQVLRVYPSEASVVMLEGACDSYLSPLERWPGAPRY